MSDDREAARGHVHVIAGLLGISVEDLLTRTMPQKLWADTECLRLWHSLKTDAGRDAALDALRSILDEERD